MLYLLTCFCESLYSLSTEFRITDSVRWLKQSLSILSILLISLQLSSGSNVITAGQVRNWYLMCMYRPASAVAIQQSPLTMVWCYLFTLVTQAIVSFCYCKLLQVLELFSCEQGQLMNCSPPLQNQRILRVKVTLLVIVSNHWPSTASSITVPRCHIHRAF